MSQGLASTRPENVGILAIEVYTPMLKVDQKVLEAAHDVAGKYTVGLGQEAMAVCSDREDVVSMALSAVSSLLAKYDVAHASIGRLEVGTESGLDRSKSIKSHLMQLFNQHGVYDVEGVDSVHACYGATAALFNTVAWVESSAWDGRLGVVVGSDVALYPLDLGSCATGGCGAVAMLVGPGAPLVLDPPWRATHSTHAYEFYKPVGRKDPYPLVDGGATVALFLAAVDGCGAALHRKLRPAGGLLGEVQHYCSHSPFNKLARKGLSRLLLQDMLRCAGALEGSPPTTHLPAQWRDLDPDLLPPSVLQDKQLERHLLEASRQVYDDKASVAAAVQQLTGNSYTASLYTGLASLLEARPPTLVPGSRILMFAFGSGVCASLFALRASAAGDAKFSLSSISAKLQLRCRLESRPSVTWRQFQAEAVQQGEAYAAAPYQPVGELVHISTGAYYLEAVDSQHRRTYRRRTAPEAAPTGTDAMPPARTDEPAGVVPEGPAVSVGVAVLSQMGAGPSS